MGEDDHLSLSFSSSSDDSIVSCSSDLTQDEASSSPLYEMSSLMDHLPSKKGLSKYYQGKSQSFTSLAIVRCLEDFAKPESPYRKKLKSCKSYGGELDSHRSYIPKISSKSIAKKTSSSCASLTSKSNGFFSNRPPVPPHRTSTLSNQTPLFA